MEKEQKPDIKAFLIKELGMNELQAQTLYSDYIDACEKYSLMVNKSLQEENRRLKEEVQKLKDQWSAETF